MKNYRNYCLALGAAILFGNAALLVSAQEKTEPAEKADVDKPATEATQEKPKEKAAPSIAGKWDIKSGSRSGAEVPQERLTAIEISDKEITIPAGPEKFVMSYKLNASKTPFEIDMKIESGPAPDGAAKGIVLLEGNKMKICYNGMGGERPDKFETVEGDSCFYFELEMKVPELNAASIVGTWEIAEGMRAGAKSPEERIAGKIVFSKDEIKIGEGDESFTMSHKLDAKKSPAEIDMKVTAGPAPVGSPAAGILKFDDKGHLILCYDAMGGPRPKTFESTEENGCFMFKMKKTK